MKKFLIVLIIIFICGLLSADVVLLQMKESSVVVGKEFYEQYANTKQVFKEVFWNVLYERIKLFAVLILFCFTPIKDRISPFLGVLFSFSWGFFLMSCIIELGVAGLVIGLASVLPHGILYGVVIVFLLNYKRARSVYMKNRIIIYLMMGIILLLLFLTGCVVESLVGTHFIPWVIRLSLV